MPMGSIMPRIKLARYLDISVENQWTFANFVSSVSNRLPAVLRAIIIQTVNMREPGGHLLFQMESFLRRYRKSFPVLVKRYAGGG